MPMRRWLSFVAVLGLVAATTQTVNAQQNYAGSGDADLLNRLSAQEQRIAELESQIPRRQQPFAMEPASWNYDSMVRRLEVLEAMVAAGDDKDGKDEWIDSHNQKWESKVGGKIHFDYVNFAQQNAGVDAELGGNDLEDYAEFRRLRLSVEGEGYGVYELQVRSRLRTGTRCSRRRPRPQASALARSP